MKYFVNPYATISSINNNYSITTSFLEKTVIIQLTEAQEIYFKKLIEGYETEIEEIENNLGRKVTENLVSVGCLINTLPDTDSIFSRTDAYFSSFGMPEARNKLNSKHTLILGCGGIGTHLAWHLASIGIKALTIVDFDEVEESNLNRQLLFDESDLGKKKVSILKEKLLLINPLIKVTSICKKITSEEVLDEIVTQCNPDLIIKAVDSPTEFPIWLDKVCKKRKTPYIAGITMRNQAMIGPTFIPGRSEIGWSDLIDLNGSSAKKLSGIAPSLGVILYHISDEIALEAVKVLTGYGDTRYCGKIVIEDLFTNQKQVVSKEPQIETSESTPNKTNTDDKKGIIISLLYIATVTIIGAFIPWMYLVSSVLSMVIPFYLFKNPKDVLMNTFTNSVVFSVISFVCVLRSGFLSVLMSNAIQTAYLVVLLFGVLSVSILLMCIINAVICKIKFKRI